MDPFTVYEGTKLALYTAANCSLTIDSKIVFVFGDTVYLNEVFNGKSVRSGWLPNPAFLH